MRFLPEPIKGQGRVEFFFIFQIDHIPTGLLPGACGIKVVAAPVELRIVWISRFHHLGTADNGWRIRVAVVEQHLVAYGHFAQKISRLVIPDSIPTRRLSRGACQIINGKSCGFGLDQPVTRRPCHVKGDKRVINVPKDISL